MRHLGLVVLGLALCCAHGYCQNATTPGQLIVQEPTLICLGFEWRIEGDANENCRVEVEYRARGERAWRKALPFLRVENRIYGPTQSLQQAFAFGNKLCGSIFDLKPDTGYEVKLHLKDPDGGVAERLVRARTRAVPVAYEKGRRLHVVPGEGGGSGSGTERNPFRGGKAADAASRPGDVILLHEGVYAGGFAATKDGEPGKPIVWRGIDAAKVIFDGGGAASAEVVKEPVVDLRRRAYVHLESVTVRNGAWGIRLEEGRDLVVRRCTVTNCDVGISAWAPQARGERFLICDNTIIGNKKWGMGVGPSAAKEVIGLEGIVPTGDGHVLCHNHIEGFSDGISLGTYHERPDGTHEYGVNNSVDVYGNEVVACLDDGIEADWGHTNVRVFRNRVTNALKGVSCQPALGGPIYVLRNELVNVGATFKFFWASGGIIALHNTSFGSQGWGGGEWYNLIARNNIYTTTDKPTISTKGYKADMDYDGLMQPAGAEYMFHYHQAYKTLEDFRRATGLERHAVQIQLGDFVAPDLPDFERGYRPGEVSVALNPAGKAVDAGELLPNVNDDFAGKGPDLGCREAGSPEPQYGPRRSRAGGGA